MPPCAWPQSCLGRRRTAFRCRRRWQTHRLALAGIYHMGAGDQRFAFGQAHIVDLEIGGDDAGAKRILTGEG